MREVQLRQHPLDKLFPELPLHEAVRDDESHEARRLISCSLLRQVEESLGEGRTEPVLHVAACVDFAIRIPHRRVLRRDVGRVADHGVVLPTEDGIEFRRVLRRVVVAQDSAKTLRRAAQLMPREVPPMQQAVTGGEVHAEGRRRGEARHAASAQRRHQQPEASDLDREGVEVHACHAAQRPLGLLCRRQARRMALPLPQQPREAAQQEVAAAAGRVDHPQLLVAEFLDGRLQRAVEDPRLHEVRRLQQRVAFARILREVLVKIAEEAGVPLGLGEVVRQRARLRHHFAEEAEQRHGAVARQRQAKQRVVRGVEQPREPGQARRLLEGGEQVFRIGIVRAGAEIGLLPLPCQVAPVLARPREEGAVHQTIVLQEAQEDAGQHPVHHRLVEGGVEEGLEGLARAAAVEGALPLGLHRLPIRPVGRAGGMRRPEVGIERAPEALQISQQALGVDHRNPGAQLFFVVRRAVAPAGRWIMRPSVESRRDARSPAKAW